MIEAYTMDLANLHAESESVNPILIYKINPTSFLLEFPNPPDFERFCVLVNYMRYPNSFHAYEPVVFGVWEIKESMPYVESNIGEKLVVYVSKHDKEYDNVSIENAQGKTYLYSFNGTIKELKGSEVDFSAHVIQPVSYTLYKKITPTYKPKKPWWKF
ncbi:MAG: hypothetical protein K0R51_729 [Cytophagaceae bacterium]|nr:hypothetical protein [Cytophagaceae bacterium]